MNIHALKNLTFQFTPVTHMVYLEIRLHYSDFAIEKLTSSNWISKYTMCVTGVNWKVKFLSACMLTAVLSESILIHSSWLSLSPKLKKFNAMFGNPKLTGFEK